MTAFNAGCRPMKEEQRFSATQPRCAEGKASRSAQTTGSVKIASDIVPNRQIAIRGEASFGIMAFLRRYSDFVTIRSAFPTYRPTQEFKQDFNGAARAFRGGFCPVEFFLLKPTGFFRWQQAGHCKFRAATLKLSMHKTWKVAVIVPPIALLSNACCRDSLTRSLQ